MIGSSAGKPPASRIRRPYSPKNHHRAVSEMGRSGCQNRSQRGSTSNSHKRCHKVQGTQNWVRVPNFELCVAPRGVQLPCPSSRDCVQIWGRIRNRGHPRRSHTRSSLPNLRGSDFALVYRFGVDFLSWTDGYGTGRFTTRRIPG